VFRAAPIVVPGDHKFTQLVTYARTTCGLRVDGLAYCWGTNNWGGLGNGSNIAYSSTPVAVAGNHVFTKLIAGAEHACGLKASGALYCWGHSDWGQFGNGNTTSSNVPVLAAGGMQFVNVSAGSTVTCGITNVGAAYCWGDNGTGQLGIGGQIPYGNVYKNTPQAVVGGHQFASITVGEEFTCGVNLNGQALCWGLDGHRLGSGNTGDASSPKAVSGGHTFKWLNSGFSHSCGINATDDVYCWGTNGYGQLGVPGAFAAVPVLTTLGVKAAEVDVAGIGTGSGGFTCAIAKDRLTTYCWGRNEFGQLGNGGTTLPSVVNYVATIVQGQKPL
jgi:alpha-tubulin suppressor-like RCC1 family protein